MVSHTRSTLLDRVREAQSAEALWRGAAAELEVVGGPEGLSKLQEEAKTNKAAADDLQAKLSLSESQR